jgi:hypothetical protein
VFPFLLWVAHLMGIAGGSGLGTSHGDVATTSILEVYIDETERRTWFLYETATGGSRTD